MDILTLQTFFESSQDNIFKLSSDIIQTERELQETDLYKKLQLLKSSRFDLEKKQEDIKLWMKSAMEFNWVKKIELQMCTITLKNNPPALKISDELMIPTKYKKEITKIEIDKAQIKIDLKGWEEVLWCELTVWISLLITPK